MPQLRVTSISYSTVVQQQPGHHITWLSLREAATTTFHGFCVYEVDDQSRDPHCMLLLLLWVETLHACLLLSFSLILHHSFLTNLTKRWDEIARQCVVGHDRKCHLF